MGGWRTELRRDEPAAAELVDALGRAIDAGGALAAVTAPIERVGQRAGS